MDDNQIIDNIHDENSDLYLTKEARQYLYKTSNWAMGFAILGFISLGFGLLGGFSMLAMSSTMPDTLTPGMGSFFPILGAIYLVFTLIFAVPVWKHFKFAQKAKDSARRQDSDSLTEAMKNLHAYYKWYGVLIIVSIVLYIVMMSVMIGQVANSANDFQF